MELEKIRQAAERVGRSEGLEIVDVEWKVGKQRFLRVYIDRVPKAAAPISDAAGVIGGSTESGGGYSAISHADCERVSQQLSVILDVEDLIPGAAGYILEVRGNDCGVTDRGDTKGQPGGGVLGRSRDLR